MGLAEGDSLVSESRTGCDGGCNAARDNAGHSDEFYRGAFRRPEARRPRQQDCPRSTNFKSKAQLNECETDDGETSGGSSRETVRTLRISE